MVPFVCRKNPEDISWRSAHADYVVESTGVFTTIDKASVRISLSPAALCLLLWWIMSPLVEVQQCPSYSSFLIFLDRVERTQNVGREQHISIAGCYVPALQS